MSWDRTLEICLLCRALSCSPLIQSTGLRNLLYDTLRYWSSEFAIAATYYQDPNIATENNSLHFCLWLSTVLYRQGKQLFAWALWLCNKGVRCEREGEPRCWDNITRRNSRRTFVRKCPQCCSTRERSRVTILRTRTRDSESGGKDSDSDWVPYSPNSCLDSKFPETVHARDRQNLGITFMQFNPSS